MAKKVLTTIKLQAAGGQASPAPPVGPALGQHGINIMEFCKAFNAQTQGDAGTVIPVVITVYEDRSFTFITKTPPAAVLTERRPDRWGRVRLPAGDLQLDHRENFLGHQGATSTPIERAVPSMILAACSTV
jgi:hypothetical protein